MEEWLVGEADTRHCIYPLSLLSYVGVVHGALKTVIVVISKIIDHHDKYENVWIDDEQVWKISGITKMWPREMKWKILLEKKNGTSRVFSTQGATNLEIVRKGSICKVQESKAKWNMVCLYILYSSWFAFWNYFTKRIILTRILSCNANYSGGIG